MMAQKSCHPLLGDTNALLRAGKGEPETLAQIHLWTLGPEWESGSSKE